MNTNIILVIFLLTILSIEFGHGLSCYQHDYCLDGCPTLSSSIVQCASDQSKCWKASSPLGVQRGCGDTRCRIQLDTGILGTASVCCTSNLCNSAISMKTTIPVIFASLIVFIFAWRM